MLEQPDPKTKVGAVKSHMFFPLGIVERTHTLHYFHFLGIGDCGKDDH